MPYRTPTPPFVPAPDWWPRVKRDLARLHPNLGAHRWFRCWAGGRWAAFALVVAPTPLVSMSDWWDAWATNDLSKDEDDTTRRWRPVESCPHGCWVTINDDPTLVWEVPYCECEVWP